jgi:Domain of unknown function (DUF4041)/Meiotically up-regulated gene 113
MDILIIVTVLVAGAAVALIVTLLVLFLSARGKYKHLFEKYKPIIQLDEAVKKGEYEFGELNKKHDGLVAAYQSKNNELNNEYQQKRKVFEDLLRQIHLLEEDLEYTTYGVYKPHYEFDTSEAYKLELDNIRKKQKAQIKEKTAAICHIEWEVGGSKREGKKMTNHYMKLMLRSFNNECDSAVLKVRWNNVEKMEERIRRAFEAINKLGSVHNIEVSTAYFNLKMEELHIAHEYEEKCNEEKEEQKRIREQMREEERVLREIEKVKKETEAEEKRYQEALTKAREEASKAKGEEVFKLNDMIARLEQQLKTAQEQKERAVSRAQLTKSGHVYVISNIGSFGQNVYKIGMTRRLEPMDRVKELGDASVPFTFDVHALIYSENAPDLENALHKTFNRKRMNLVNNRKEFFKISLDEIDRVVQENHGEVEFTKLAEAREYRETITIEQRQQQESVDDKIEEQFPKSLF